MLEFKTIRQTAATGLISEERLRCLVAEGNCPGFFSGNRFMVNFTALVEYLDEISRGRAHYNGAKSIYEGRHKQ